MINYPDSANPNLMRKISITEDMSDNTEKAQENRAGYKRSRPTRGMEARDERAVNKSSGPTEASKHRTKEQAIKVAGPRRQASTGQ